jgi:hypothetical protein
MALNQMLLEQRGLAESERKLMKIRIKRRPSQKIVIINFVKNHVTTNAH